MPKSQAFLDKFTTRMTNPLPEGQVHLSHKNFLLPAFISFSDSDETLEIYQQDKRNIEKIYRSKNRLDITLQQLLR